MWMPCIFLLQILLLLPLAGSKFHYQIDYESLAEKVQNELLSAEDIESFFSLLLKVIDPYPLPKHCSSQKHDP